MLSKRGKGLLLAVFVLCGWTSCTAQNPNDPQNKGAEEGRFFRTSKKPAAVTSFKVAGQEIPLVINADGRTQASDRYEAKAPKTIRVQKVFVEEGAQVSSGDALIKFDDQEGKLKTAMARAEIKEAEAGLAYNNYLQQNKAKLLEENKLSETEADGLDERIDLWQATLDRAKAEIDLFEGLTDLVQLNSPIAGTVTKKNASDGADVAEDQVLLEVLRLDPIQFVFSVPTEAVNSLEKGAQIAVRFASLPGQDLTGDIVSVGSEVVAGTGGSTGGLEVKLNIPNAALLVKAGIKGNVVIHTQAKKQVFPVPDAAIVRSERSQYVFKLDGNRVKRIPVDLGDPIAGQLTVTKGLADGDLIVAAPDMGLKDGMTVELQTGGATK